VIRPIVYIIGAGPGDPGLLTARGARCLARADVVVYDTLIQPSLLRYARPDAEQIDVGRSAPRRMEQEAISYLLLEKAREGKVIARLKWGDPFVFDDGGEEALFLHEHGVAFEMVPGVPAALGAPAYAGIAVTYRGGGDLLTFVRGQESSGHTPLRIDWAAVAKIDGTLACYLGPRQLGTVTHALLSHGRPPDEPAAFIVNGTLPTQQTVQSSLDKLADMSAQIDQSGPGVLVVGRVLGLREHMRWFDTRPLFGKRIVVTRPREQAAELIDLLAELGAITIEAPAIRLVEPEDYAALDEACGRAGEYDWIVFTSANGVDRFMARLMAGPGDVRDLKGVRLCAIGPATAEHLAKHGVKVDLMPREYRAEAVVDALRAWGDLSGVRVLLPRADIARELLAEELRRSGAEVDEVTAYRTVPVESERSDAPDIYKMLLERQIDVVTFTSASTVKNFVRMLGGEVAADLLQHTVVACIGPVTAEAAEQYQIRTAVVANEYTIPGLVEAIVRHFGENRGDSTTGTPGV
jgi:uroporphyrinogen III methyltransferase/synthase